MTEKKSPLPTLSFTLFDSFEEPGLWSEAIGSNSKGIIVFSAENQPLSEDLFNFLKKVLEAVQIQLEEEALFIFTTPEKNYSFVRISREKDIRVLISFGLPAKNLGLHWSVNLYEPLSRNGCLFLFAERLSLIQNDRERKLKLWKALQKVFTP